MPIHLPPLSRRSFLASLAAAGAGCTASRSGKSTAPDRWALLSDTHIDASPKMAARGVVMTENLRAVASHVSTQASRFERVLVNGDCAYLKGVPGDYANLVQLLEPMRKAGLPVHLTLGNHDDRVNFRAGVGTLVGGKTAVSDRHVSLIRGRHANWLLLDSLDQVNVTPGLLGEAQLTWLARTLDAEPQRPAIICAHHNPLEAAHRGGLQDWEKLLAVLAPRRQAKAFIFGHTHNWRTLQDASGLHLINLPPVAYVFNPARPNGWVDAEVSREGLRLTLQCLDAKHTENGQVIELAWRA
jgi:predicted phosphodiesterase